jgi:beta-phosphoglucomutase-like phosphatase (HAD superfamily)
VLGLPDGITACLFDLDGVLTSTATLHRAAWKETFDALLRERAGAGFAEFTEQDYLAHVDGRPRYDGVREFLTSRGITLPEGQPDDSPDTPTVHGVGNRKNALLQDVIDREGVAPYPGSVRYLQAAADAGVAIGVVTSSANAAAVLEAAGLATFVQTRIDGVMIQRDGLRGKPAPDSFLAGAREDALSGVAAGRAGGFGHVVGVDRAGQAAALSAHGADVVVADLAELLS